MTLQQAFSAFTIELPTASEGSERTEPDVLDTLLEYFGENARIEDVSPERVRDFLGRWWIERLFTPAAPAAAPGRAEMESLTRSLIERLATFIEWLGTRGEVVDMTGLAGVTGELTRALPRAIRLTSALAAYCSARGGPFNFPEFLTTFEEGGQSEYDFGEGGEPLSLEGHFRVTRVDRRLVELMDLATGASIGPVPFPHLAIVELEAGMVINLELVKGRDGWSIHDAGFAYPPGTDL